SNLKNSKERFEKLVQLLPEIVIETDEQGDILYTNNQGFELTGYTPEEFEKRKFNIFEMTADCDREKMKKNVEMLIKKDRIDPQEYRIKRKNGRTFPIISRSNPIRDDRGRFRGLRTVAIDITDYKNNQKRVLENIKKYKTFFENSPVSMWEEDFSGAVKYIMGIRNTGVSDIRKYLKEHPEKLKECIKQIGIKNVNKASLKLYEARTKSDLLEGLGICLVEDATDFFIDEILAVADGKTLFEGETVNRTVTGKTINIYLTLIVMPGYEKTRSRILISILDLTSIRNAEKKLIESERQYRSLFENSLDGIYRSTVDGKYIDVNRSLVEMLGYGSREELLSVNTRDLYLSPDSRPEPDKRGKPFITQLKKKDKTPIWVEINSRVVKEDSNSVYYEGIVRDITERIKAEEKIKYLYFHDNLTGLYNKNYFEEELKRLDTPRQYPLALIFFDINGLKIINDTFGIKRGDRLIRKISEISKDFFRKDDILVRWSGGEFAVLMPKTSKEDVKKIIERLEKVFIKNSSSTLPLSVSFGHSVKSKNDKSVKVLIKTAEEKMGKHKLNVNESAHSSIIDSLKKALEERDYETEEHGNRLVSLTMKTGKVLKLSESKLDELVLLAKLHDIGKIAIPDNIILKPARLSKREYDTIKKHSEIGYRIALSSRVLAPVAGAILSHHERWDGTGYPHGLKNDEIPIISRILAVADAYDAMTNDRPYRKALSEEEAIRELKICSGTQFDPEIVKIFLRIIGDS
ncbi:MAG: PAS domain S-box protein, partial [Actinobacteria bacterium]|nr:PAS domain S-box protein [Actinomycetota bacterium]